MAAKVLQELDQLRSMLRPDSCSYTSASLHLGSGEASMSSKTVCSTSSTAEVRPCLVVEEPIPSIYALHAVKPSACCCTL
jgi:hypothetical protein